MLGADLARKIALERTSPSVTEYVISSPTPLTPSDQILYDLPAAAQVLGGISVDTLRAENRAGRIAFKRIGRLCFVHRDELESYAEHLPST